MYASFNNDHQGHAVTDASWLRARLDGQPQPES